MDCSNTFNSDCIGDLSDSSSETVKIASCSSPFTLSCAIQWAMYSNVFTPMFYTTVCTLFY